MNSIVANNQASGCCGGIHIGNGAKVSLIDTLVEGNMGAGAGGIGVYSGSIVSIGNSTILENISTADGGGLAAYDTGTTLNIAETLISRNTSGDGAPPGNGGGLYMRSGAEAELQIVEFFQNSAYENGGAIHLDDAGTRLNMADSLVHDNGSLQNGGAIAVGGADITVSNSTIEDNKAPRGVGGLADVYGGATLEIVDSMLLRHQAKDHGGAFTVMDGSKLFLSNVQISGSRSTEGPAGVLAAGDSDVVIINSTIAHNNFQGHQAIILWSGGTLEMNNSIMWKNLLNLQADPPCSDCFDVTYSDIEGGWPGTGNIDADPMFWDPNNWDLQLMCGSPAVDAGTAVGAPPNDIVGNPRDAKPDMGAYELALDCGFMPMILRP
jgi:predicted outer membrane repeat protein